MRIVLDTDVASNILKGKLDPAFRAQIAAHQAAITCVTVGELMKWAYVRYLGASRRSDLHAFIESRPKIPGGNDVGCKWGEITAYADRRGRSLTPGSATVTSRPSAATWAWKSRLRCAWRAQMPPVESAAAGLMDAAFRGRDQSAELR